MWLPVCLDFQVWELPELMHFTFEQSRSVALVISKMNLDADWVQENLSFVSYEIILISNKMDLVAALN